MTLQTWSRSRDESRDLFLRVLVTSLFVLRLLILQKKWLSKTSIIQQVFVCCICR